MEPRFACECDEIFTWDELSDGHRLPSDEATKIAQKVLKSADVWVDEAYERTCPTCGARMIALYVYNLTFSGYLVIRSGKENS